ncbi:extracellular solute-binding protein [Paenibacillus sp. H1-7]|uniref:extracellular solute-binding protein n=1 Tax=Paenibacillus sp. H1-7 TaxID=2282849 RepID=UPI001EF882B8|nr:extracellular solute-binding protein [Paenibacillus sp. H1-7]ULL14999.1 extracellular solute-binding protein [Paenibacillus sp. H1-7]
MHTKARTLLLLVSILSIVSAGCTGRSQDARSPQAGSTSNASTAAEVKQQPGAYPIQTSKTLTYWAELNQNAASVKSTFEQVPFFQEWQKRTGVKLKFIQAQANQDKTALNVLLASGDLPDMMEYAWNSFPGGPEKAINDGYILKLNDVIDKYAPNLKQFLKEHPEIDKQIKTDEGHYYVFPFIRNDPMLQTFQGPIIRKDWLDELGLPIPETIDDWYVVLKAFKEKKGIEAPLTFLSVPNVLFGMDNGAFIGAYGVKKGFYLDEGKVKFGPIEGGYKEFLRTFRRWYEEGLIDRNMATVDIKTMDSNMMLGRSGASIWNAGSGIGKWQPALQAKDPKAVVTAAPYPVLKRGDKPKFGQKSEEYVGSGSVAIAGNSKNVEEAARMLDYGYSEAGHMFFNFGIEGTSYNMEGDYPKYTELIMSNKEQLVPAQALAMYNRASYFGPFIQDRRYIEQAYTLSQQKEAIPVWAQNDAERHTLPLIHKTEKESSESAAIMMDVMNLVDEMSIKIILGVEPVDAYDNYVEKIKALNVKRAIDIEQQALDRYNFKS